MSDTPETNAAAFDAFDGQGGEVVFADFAKKLERERNSPQDQRDFCMGEIEQLRKERDEAIRALTNITALPTLAVDQNVVRARKIAQEALRNVEGAK